MKKILLSISIFATLLTGCSGDSESDPVNMNPASCSSAITNFSVQQSGDRIDFNITATQGALYYEASICPTGQCSGPGSSTIIPLDVQTNSISISGYPFMGDMVVHLRTVCADNTRSEWYGPVLLSIDEFCATPHNLSLYGTDFRWEYDSAMPHASNFQVQYGPQGFALGSGTTATVNTLFYDGASMEAGQAYDFYVRAYCINGIGYGNWAGPYTHMSQTNVNMCLPPLNIVADIDNGNSSGTKWVTFTWNANGENSFEYTLVQLNNGPEEGTIETTNSTSSDLYILSTYNEYTFYVRAICNDGSRTEWSAIDIDLL